jgi:hypothetical protein
MMYFIILFFVQVFAEEGQADVRKRYVLARTLLPCAKGWS